jgi:hypothetical protein
VEVAHGGFTLQCKVEQVVERMSTKRETIRETCGAEASDDRAPDMDGASEKAVCDGRLVAKKTGWTGV